jgi:DNA (cytosine-5)-methyltransferase 1
MNYLSVCSGIEAATVAWHPLGWKAVAYSEIEPFPSAVLAHHYPDVPNVGDMTKFKEWDFGSKTIDLLVGGTPCQSFSVAGLRKGLDDPRGNLALIYCGILDKFRPKWFVWENVPGVLSSNGGRDFGSFLGAVAELGYGFAYRVLDAQYFGVAQRRRRVFVVGHIGNWRSAAEVLFEPESLRRNSAPSKTKRKEIAGTITDSFGISNSKQKEFVATFDRQSSSEYGTAPIASTMSARDYKSASDLIMKTTAYDVTFCDANGTRKDRPNGGLYVNQTQASKTITAGGDISTYIAQPIYMGNAEGGALEKPFLTCHNLGGTAGISNQTPLIGQSMAVRRLTVLECERLQGFPNKYTNIPYRNKRESPDGPRYKALGNSMAVPVMHWIGGRIANVI